MPNIQSHPDENGYHASAQNAHSAVKDAVRALVHDQRDSGAVLSQLHHVCRQFHSHASGQLLRTLYALKKADPNAFETVLDQLFFAKSESLSPHAAKVHERVMRYLQKAIAHKPEFFQRHLAGTVGDGAKQLRVVGHDVHYGTWQAQDFKGAVLEPNGKLTQGHWINGTLNVESGSQTTRRAVPANLAEVERQGLNIVPVAGAASSHAESDIDRLVQTLQQHAASKTELVTHLYAAKLDAVDRGECFELQFIKALSQLQSNKNLAAFDQVFTQLFHIDREDAKLQDSVLQQRFLLHELHTYTMSHKREVAAFTRHWKRVGGNKFGANKRCVYYRNSLGMHSSGSRFNRDGDLINGKWSVFGQYHHGRSLSFRGKYQEGNFDEGLLLKGVQIDGKFKSEGLFSKAGWFLEGTRSLVDKTIEIGKFHQNNLIDGVRQYSDGKTEQLTTGKDKKIITTVVATGTSEIAEGSPTAKARVHAGSAAAPTGTGIPASKAKAAAKQNQFSPESIAKIPFNLENPGELAQGMTLLCADPGALLRYLQSADNPPKTENRDQLLATQVLKAVNLIGKAGDADFVARIMDAIFTVSKNSAVEVDMFQSRLINEIVKLYQSKSEGTQIFDQPFANGKKCWLSGQVFCYGRSVDNNAFKGTVVYENSYMQVGKWQSGHFKKGIILIHNGIKHVGTFDEKRNLMQGKARLLDGRVDSGIFDKNQLAKGKRRHANGVTEKGVFKKGWLVSGKQRFSDGLIQKGRFSNGRLVSGKQTFPEGVIHEGKFEKGRLVFGSKLVPSEKSGANGECLFSRFEGEFKNGICHVTRDSGLKYDQRMVDFQHDKVTAYQKDDVYYRHFTGALLNAYQPHTKPGYGNGLTKQESDGFLTEMLSNTAKHPNYSQNATVSRLEKTVMGDIVSSFPKMMNIDRPIADDALKTMLHNQQNAAVLINGGSKGHAMCYLVYQDRLYVFNKGDAARDQTHARGPQLSSKTRAIEVYQLTGKESDDLAVISALFRDKFDGASAIYHKLDTDLKKDENSIFKAAPKQNTQRLGNCWLMSPLATIYGVGVLSFQTEIAKLPEADRAALCKHHHVKTDDDLALKLGRNFYKNNFSKRHWLRNLARDMGKEAWERFVPRFTAESGIHASKADKLKKVLTTP